MKIKLIAIAAIALSPAVMLGQTRTHIRVSKDGSHTTSTGDVTTSPSSTTTRTDSSMSTTPSSTYTAPSSTTTTTTDSSSSQLGTGAAAPTPTHSQQTDSAVTGTDTLRVPRNNLNVAPVDSVKMGIPSTQETLRADSARAAQGVDSLRNAVTDTLRKAVTDSTKPPR
jgi:hypothetical protein